MQGGECGSRQERLHARPQQDPLQQQMGKFARGGFDGAEMCPELAGGGRLAGGGGGRQNICYSPSPRELGESSGSWEINSTVVLRIPSVGRR